MYPKNYGRFPIHREPARYTRGQECAILFFSVVIGIGLALLVMYGLCLIADSAHPVIQPLA